VIGIGTFELNTNYVGHSLLQLA